MKSIEEDRIKNIDVIDEIHIDSPTQNISEKYMQSSWVKYAKILEANGRYNIASILDFDSVLTENLISYTVPNDTRN